MGDREVRKIDQKAEVGMPRPHVRREPGGERSRTDEGRLVHVVVEHLQLDMHPLRGSVGAQVAGGLEKLAIRDILGLFLPFAGKKRDALRAEILRLVHGLHQGLLRLLPLRLVDGVRVELRPKQPRLGAIADRQVALPEQLPLFLSASVILVLRDLDRVEERVAGYRLHRLKDRTVRIAHPKDRSHLEILVNRFFHISTSIKHSSFSGQWIPPTPARDFSCLVWKPR